MVNTRKDVVQGWNAVAQMLDHQGEHNTAAMVTRFVRQMPPPRTEKELIAGRLQAVPERSQPDRDWILTR